MDKSACFVQPMALRAWVQIPPRNIMDNFQDSFISPQLFDDATTTLDCYIGLQCGNCNKEYDVIVIHNHISISC